MSPTDAGLPDMSEYAAMGNAIRMGKSYEDLIKDGFPDTPLFRQRYAALTKSVNEMIAKGQTPDWDFD